MGEVSNGGFFFKNGFMPFTGQGLFWSDQLTYRRVVVRLATSDDFSFRFFSKPSEPGLQNQELIENS